VSSGVCRSLITTLTVAAALAGAVGCAQEVSTNPLETGAVANGPPGSDQPVTPESVHDTIEAALNDIVSFWEEEFPAVYGSELEALEGGFQPYGSGTDPLPCGDPSYDEIANNAFYCPEEDLIAWDEEELMPTLAEEFGPFTVAIVLAHEFGHAIQPRADVPDLPTIFIENQADCFAGAWTRWVAEGNSDDFTANEESLDQALSGIISFRDAPGTSAADPMAHGLGFDRVNAFQEGWEQGAARCAEYADDPPDPTQIPFSEGELATGGNMPLEDEGDSPGLLSLLERNLNVYYEQLFQQRGATWAPVDDVRVVDPSSDEVTCDGETLPEDELEFASLYCEQENVVVLDGENLVPNLEELGDFAVGAEVTRLYSRAAQIQLGVDEESPQANLQADCLLGVWAADNYPNPETGESPFGQRVGERPDREDIVLYLSAGDLDEAIQGFLSFGETPSEDTGTAFERTTALRKGFLPPGIQACEEYGPLGG
jgi:predicted metalloprotease